MVVRLKQPKIQDADYALGVNKGGTLGMGVDNAAKNIQWVRRKDLGVSGGVAILNENAKLLLETLPSSFDNQTVSIGPNNTAIVGAFGKSSFTGSCYIFD